MTNSTGRVEIVREADATGEVAELYGDLREMIHGLVPDVFKLVSTRPDMLGVFVAGYRSMFDGSGQLPQEAKEVIALTVARVASCQYCITAHDALLRLLGTDSNYADAVVNGALDDPAIPTDVRALAELATTITQHAYRITDDDLDRVRSHGWDQSQVLEAVWVACLFNAIVRLADTFGLRDLGQLTDDSVSVSSPG
ncbi:MAG: peroxidase-related enzyme [Acidimicrobiales bacterium]